MSAPPASSPTAGLPPEAIEAVVSAGPAAAASLLPVLTVFARLAGLGARRARTLAAEVVEVVATSCRRAGPVRLQLVRRPRRLRVLVRSAVRGGAAFPRALTRKVHSGLRIRRAGRCSLVLTLPGPFRDP